MPDSDMPDSYMDEFAGFDVNTYIPGTEEDKQALKKAKIALELGSRNVAEDKHGNEYHLPAPPRLSEQASMASLIAQRLYIDLPGITETEDAKKDRKTKVTTAINTINTLLRKVKLRWNITYDSINDKLLKNPRYLANTFYGLWNLKAGIEFAMHDSLYGDNRDKEGEKNVIIDYSNLKFRLGDCETPVDRALADKIHAWMQDTGRFRRIVISIQANDKDRPEFIEFKTRLIELFEPPTAVIIVIGADASSYDDLNIAYIVINLLPFSIKYIITSDNFRDISKLEDSNDESIGTPIYSSVATDIILIKTQNFCNPSHRLHTPSSSGFRGPVSSGHGFSGHGSSSGFRGPVSSGHGFSGHGSSSGFPRYGYGGPGPSFSGHGSSSGFPGYGYGGPGPSFSGHGYSSSGPSSSLHGSSSGFSGHGYIREDGFTRKRNRGSYGGTNKNKKSLLNKYTRKVKKLHKKRIPTKKVVKKYNKNYKNYKKKTLKRKNK